MEDRQSKSLLAWRIVVRGVFPAPIGGRTKQKRLRLLAGRQCWMAGWSTSLFAHLPEWMNEWITYLLSRNKITFIPDSDPQKLQNMKEDHLLRRFVDAWCTWNKIPFQMAIGMHPTQTSNNPKQGFFVTPRVERGRNAISAKKRVVQRMNRIWTFPCWPIISRKLRTS